MKQTTPNWVALNHSYFIMLMDSVGQEFRQDIIGNGYYDNGVGGMENHLEAV